MVFPVHQARAQLSKLLDLVNRGEDVTITRHGKAVAKLVAAGDKPKKLRLGAMKGEFTYQKGWDKPLSAQEADAFWEARW